MKVKYLDKEEKDLEKSINEIDTTRFRKPSKQIQKEFKAAAKAHLKNTAKMNIRIDSAELDKIKQYAESQGLKYQTFIKSVLHKYITGQLVEKNEFVS
jgi:predicted DNA binding CopG/RHH family protein